MQFSTVAQIVLVFQFIMAHLIVIQSTSIDEEGNRKTPATSPLDLQPVKGNSKKNFK